MKRTRVAGRLVPLKSMDKRMVLHFHAGEHGPQEAGDYAFWTLVLPRNGGITARARDAKPPGERFDRMGAERKTAKSKAVRAAYERMYEGARSAVAVRPARRKEVLRWLKAHLSDAPYLVSASVGGRRISFHGAMERWALAEMDKLGRVVANYRNLNGHKR